MSRRRSCFNLSRCQYHSDSLSLVRGVRFGESSPSGVFGGDIDIKGKEFFGNCLPDFMDAPLFGIGKRIGAAVHRPRIVDVIEAVEPIKIQIDLLA